MDDTEYSRQIFSLKEEISRQTHLEIELLWLQFIEDIESEGEIVGSVDEAFKVGQIIEHLYQRIYETACGYDLPEDIIF